MTHLVAGICRSLIGLDRSARFYSATTLVQELQRALPRPQAERAGGTRPITPWPRPSTASIATPCW